MKVSLPYVGRALTLGTLLLGLSLGAKAQDADGIVVYNAQHESLTQAWADGFTRETGIKVTIRNGGDTELGNQIVQEGAASPADVFLTENSPAMALVDQAGLFAPVDADTLAQVPEGFRPPDGHWIGIAARSTVFAYDKTQADARTSCRSRCSTSPIRAGRAAGPRRPRAPISRPSSARCWSSRASTRPRPG